MSLLKRKNKHKHKIAKALRTSDSASPLKTGAMSMSGGERKQKSAEKNKTSSNSNSKSAEKIKDRMHSIIRGAEKKKDKITVQKTQSEVQPRMPATAPPKALQAVPSEVPQPKKLTREQEQEQIKNFNLSIDRLGVNTLKRSSAKSALSLQTHSI
ncbi:hypothetical protein Y032_0009g471 [Ancylostoma ceylanicum]|uniref:Uncharacterized protein n=1 Tax=Ancylostoma ceylanicum TaxID=53326 RepID=A0A016VJT2_9BILA|nr:hypothetical protein Y032_0009g471 [Ancylostoma ceylanicum]